MESVTRWLERATSWIVAALRWYIILLMAALVGLTFVQVVARYLAHNPFTATDQYARIVLVWLTFMGGAVAMLQEKNVRIDTLDHVLPERVKKALAVFFDLILIYLMVVLVDKGYEVYQVGAYQSILGTPFSYQIMYASLVVGAALMGLFVIVRLLRRLTAGRSPDRTAGGF
jgi:TRAP-type C4-dicarboxylate transport system permease small subunit